MDVRIADVFISGPLQIYVSTFLKGFLKWFMLITGIMNILYNGHNVLFFNNYIKNYIKPITTAHGKTQIHRIYNIMIMYPIFLYIILYCKLPRYIIISLLINLIVGLSYNLYYLYKYRNEYSNEYSTLR